MPGLLQTKRGLARNEKFRLGTEGEKRPKAELVGQIPDPDLMAPQPPHEVPSRLVRPEYRRDLAAYLSDEIRASQFDRAPYIQNLTRWESIYRAKLPEGVKRFPFTGASNLTVPLAQEFVDILVANFRQTLLVPGPIWILKDLAKEWERFKVTMERFLDLAGRRELQLPDKFETYILEVVKFGTGVMKVDHYYEEEIRYFYNREAEQVAPEKRVKKSGPALWNVPLEHFYIPFSETDIQDSPWVSMFMELNHIQMKKRVASGQYAKDAVERLWAFHTDEADEVKEKREELEDTQPHDRQKYHIHEVWFSAPLDGEGVKDETADIDVEMIGYLSPETREFLSLRFNPYWHEKRPFVHDVYMPVQHRFYGMGAIEKCEPGQIEISSIHNQRLDQGTILNTPIWKVKKGSRAFGPNDAIYPGKKVFVSDMDDFDRVPIGDVAPSTIANEQIARGIYERLLGINEAQAGTAMPVSRTTATAQLALLQEGAKRKDHIIGKMRNTISEIGELTLSYYFQFGAGSKPVVWLGSEGEVLNGIFALPKRASELGIGIEASAPTSQINKEIQKQNSIALFNLLTQMYERIIEMTANVKPEALEAVFGGLITSAITFMTQTLEQFDVKNIDEVLIGLRVLDKVLPTPEDFGGMTEIEQLQQEEGFLGDLQRLRAQLESRLDTEDVEAVLNPQRSDGIPRERPPIEAVQ